MKKVLQPASTGNNNGYTELTEIKIESAQPAEQAEIPLVDDVMGIVASYDIQSLSRLNEWRQELPRSVAPLTRPVDKFITPYLDKNPRIKNLCELSDAGEFKRTDEQEALELSINLALNRLEGQSLPQQIECLQAVLTRRFEQNKTVSEVPEDKVSLLDERKEDSALFEQNHEVNSVYQDLQKFYFEEGFSNHTNFIDWVILNCLIQKTLLGARVAGTATGQAPDFLGEASAAAEGVLDILRITSASTPYLKVLMVITLLFDAVGIGFVADGLKNDDWKKQDIGLYILFGSTGLALLNYLVAKVGGFCAENRAVRGLNRFMFYARVHNATLPPEVKEEQKPEEQPEEQKSPRNG